MITALRSRRLNNIRTLSNDNTICAGTTPFRYAGSVIQLCCWNFVVQWLNFMGKDRSQTTKQVLVSAMASYHAYLRAIDRLFLETLD
jgi:hypothetical protein